MKFFTKKTTFIAILFFISTPSYSANRVRILGEELVPVLKKAAALPKHFLLKSTEASKRLIYVSPRYQQNGSYFEGAATPWVSSPSIFWAGAIGLGSVLGYYSIDSVACAPYEMEKVSSHWGIPREGYRPRKIQEAFEKRIDDERKKKDSGVLVVQGPLGAGKTVLTCGSVLGVRQRDQKFLGHFFHSVDDKKSLKKQMVSFAYYLGMPRSETNYEKARSFIEERLTKPDAKGFVIIFDGATDAKRVNKFLFKNPKLEGLQIITTQDEKFYGYQKAWDWTYFPVSGLEKEEAVEFLLLGLSDRIKENQKVDQEKAKKLVDIIGSTLPFNIVDLITQINLEEITIDEVIHQKTLPHDNIVKIRLQRKPEEIRNILYLLSAVPYAEIPLSLVEVLNDSSSKTSSSLVMRQLVREGILKNTRADVYEIHPLYQKAAMEVYLDEKRVCLDAMKRKKMWQEYGKGVALSASVVGMIGIFGKERGWITGIVGAGVGVLAALPTPVLIGLAVVGVGLSVEQLFFPTKNDAPSDDILKKEFLERMSKNIVQGCSSATGMEKCKGFLSHLEAIQDKCKDADIDVKDMKRLIRKLK